MNKSEPAAGLPLLGTGSGGMQMVFLHPNTQMQQALPGDVTNPVKKKKRPV